MKTILFGTTNPAKILQVGGALAPIGVKIEGFDPTVAAIEVVEDGMTAAENAHKKARVYAEAAGRPVFAMDNALYFDGLPSQEQPGLHVRRIGRGEERPTDADLLAHYARLVERLGGEVGGWWELAVCIATPEAKLVEAVIKSPRRFVSAASKTVAPGYPLESIQIDPNTGKYVSEMSQSEQDAFWQRVIGGALALFVTSAIGELGF